LLQVIVEEIDVGRVTRSGVRRPAPTAHRYLWFSLSPDARASLADRRGRRATRWTAGLQLLL